MNDQMEALARRAVACKHWRWMPGMQTQDFTRVCYDTGYSARGWDEWDNTCSECDGGIVTLTSACLPELSDPATLGCLLALVREAWNDPGIACVTSSYSNGRYYRRVVDGHHHGSTFQTLSQVTHSTEAEALVAALEAAP